MTNCCSRTRRRATVTTAEPSAAEPSADAQGEQPAQAGAGGEQPARGGLPHLGNSKDHRGDPPQIVIGMAVTRTGIQVRVWSWPGNTTDTALIRQARADLRETTLARVVWVGDRGFTSAANRRELRAGGHGYILGERLRSGSAEATAALARPDRYRTVADNLQVKEVHIAEDERFVVCYNPEAADRDAALRQVMVAKLTELIAGSDKLSERKRAEPAGQLSTMPALRCYLRPTGVGLLRLDKAAIATEARLDGKYLLRCSDPTLSAEDIALGYKQFLAVERGWRDLKTHLELRPVYHRLEARIRAHVLLCWLALLLVRIIETRTGRTWATVCEDLQDLHVGVFTGTAGTFTQTSEPTTATKAVLAALQITPPRRSSRSTLPPDQAANGPAGPGRLVTGALPGSTGDFGRLPGHIRHQTVVLLRNPGPWLTVFRLPPYAHELNPVEPVWAHLKRSLANLTKHNILELTALVKTRLRWMQYRPGCWPGSWAAPGLSTDRSCNIRS